MTSTKTYFFAISGMNYGDEAIVSGIDQKDALANFMMLDSLQKTKSEIEFEIIEQYEFEQINKNSWIALHDNQSYSITKI